MNREIRNQGRRGQHTWTGRVRAGPLPGSRRETINNPTPQVANRVTNTSDFRLLFKDWAGITVKASSS